MQTVSWQQHQTMERFKEFYLKDDSILYDLVNETLLDVMPYPSFLNDDPDAEMLYVMDRIHAYFEIIKEALSMTSNFATFEKDAITLTQNKNKTIKYTRHIIHEMYFDFLQEAQS